MLLGFRFNRMTLSRSIFNKFVIAFVVAGLAPLIVLGYFLLDAFSRQSESFNDGNLSQMSLYMAKNVEQQFEGYNNISKLLYDEIWYEPLTNPMNKFSKSEVEPLLTSILGMDIYIENVYYVPAESNKIIMQSRKAKVFERSQFPLQEINRKLSEKPMGLVIYPTHYETYFNESNVKVITMARQLLDTSTVLHKEPKIVGTLIIDVNVSIFQNLFDQIELGPEDYIDMVDRDGFINYSSRPDRIGQLHNWSNRGSGADKAGLLVVNDLPGIGQELIGHFSKKDFFYTFVQFKGIVTTLLIGCLAVLLLLSLTFSRRFSRPIRDIMSQMSRIEQGNLDVNLEVKSEDELGQLTRSVNKMAKQLDSFIQDAYVAQIWQKQAELNALKGQIRPHYLYNTLEVIRMSAVSNDDMAVADMIHSLSNQLEYVLDYGENMVKLSSELQNVKDYMALIGVRYEELVNLTMSTAPDVSPEWGVPKLSVQPFIENAVEHGILPKDEAGGISLEVVKRDEYTLVIRITDDGVGMEADELLKLEEQLDEPSRNGGVGGFGMKNVHQRVRSLFGERYGVSVSSLPSVGTCVEIVIPIIREVEKHEPERYSGG